MIQLNELRRGNRVFVLFIDAIIEEIYENKALVKYKAGKKDVFEYEHLKGIALTPELLEKAGFEKSQSNDIYERTIYGIQVANNTSLYFDVHKDWMRDEKDIEWYLSYEWNNNHFKNDFLSSPKYLHQLQNLYFALTGQELTVNL